MSLWAALFVRIYAAFLRIFTVIENRTREFQQNEKQNPTQKSIVKRIVSSFAGHNGSRKYGQNDKNKNIFLYRLKENDIYHASSSLFSYNVCVFFYLLNNPVLCSSRTNGAGSAESALKCKQVTVNKPKYFLNRYQILFDYADYFRFCNPSITQLIRAFFCETNTGHNLRPPIY